MPMVGAPGAGANTENPPPRNALPGLILGFFSSVDRRVVLPGAEIEQTGPGTVRRRIPVGAALITRKRGHALGLWRWNRPAIRIQAA